MTLFDDIALLEHMRVYSTYHVKPDNVQIPVTMATGIVDNEFTISKLFTDGAITPITTIFDNSNSLIVYLHDEQLTLVTVVTNNSETWCHAFLYSCYEDYLEGKRLQVPSAVV